MSKKSPYAELDKAALVAAVKERRAAGRKLPVDLRADEDNLRTALDTDDVENGDFPPASDTKPPKGAKEITPSAVKLLASARADGVQHREVPDDLDDYKGRYKYRREGEFAGEVFGLKVLPDHEVRAHRTHHAKCARGFWDGTAAEFREHFDKL